MVTFFYLYSAVVAYCLINSSLENYNRRQRVLFLAFIALAFTTLAGAGFNLLISAAAVVLSSTAVAALTSYHGPPLKLRNAFARKYGLKPEDDKLVGSVRDHAVEISWSSLSTTVAVKPSTHCAKEITFMPGPLVTDSTGASIRVVNSAIDSGYRWTGDEMRQATFVSPPVREVLKVIGCSWNGERLEASCAPNSNVAGRTLKGLLKLADAMTTEARSEVQRAEWILDHDPNPDLRDHVLSLMHRRFVDRFPGAARRALEDSDPNVRLLAKSLLGLDEQQAPTEEQLLHIATTPSPENGRRVAIRLLRQHGSMEAVRALAQIRSEPRFRRDVETTIAAIQNRHDSAEGRVSLVVRQSAGQLSDADQGALSPTSTED